jgi:hypothetical protein
MASASSNQWHPAAFDEPGHAARLDDHGEGLNTTDSAVLSPWTGTSSGGCSDSTPPSARTSSRRIDDLAARRSHSASSLYIESPIA